MRPARSLTPLLSRAMFLVLVSLLFIGQAQGSYLQVQNGTSITYYNSTEANGNGIYVSFLPFTENVNGVINYSFYIKTSADGNGITAHIFKNGVELTTDGTSSGGYVLISGTINTKINTTDTIGLYIHIGGSGYTAWGKDFTMSYAYVPAPAILSPSNNSAQTSRIVNITTNATGGIQYQVSQQSDFSTLLYNSTTSNNFSGNLTLPTGLNYIRVRGYNVTEDSVTNWSNTIQSYISLDNGYVIGTNNISWLSNISSNDNLTVSSDGYLLQGIFFAGAENGYHPFNITESGTAATISSDVSHSGASSYSANVTLAGSVSSMNITGIITSPLTLIAWMNNVTGLPTTVGFFGGLNPITWIGIDNANIGYNYYRRNATSGYIGTSIPISSGWHQIKFKFNNTHTNYFLDGQSVYLNSLDTIPTKIAFGSYWTTQNSYMRFDDIRLKYTGRDNGTMSTNSLNTTPIYGSASYWDAVRLNTSSVLGGNVSLYVNQSDDNITFSGFQLISNNITSGNIYLLPLSKKKIAIFKIEVYDNGTDSPFVYSLDVYQQAHNNISGFVHYPNGTVMPNARVVTAHETKTTDLNGYYEFINISATPANLTIVVGVDGYYPNASILLNLNETIQINNFNFTLVDAPTPNPNQIQLISYNSSVNYIPFINSSGHLYNLPYNESNLSAFQASSEALLFSAFAVGSLTANFTPEYKEIGLRLANHINYDIVRTGLFNGYSSHIYSEAEYNQGTQTEFILLPLLQTMVLIRNNVSSTQWDEWNNTMKQFNYSQYSPAFLVDSPEGYILSNWYVIRATDEAYRYQICGSCVNTTHIDYIIQRMNNSVTDLGYYQGAELSSNYNSFMYLLGNMIVESGYQSDILNNTLTKNRIQIMNSFTQDGCTNVFGRTTGFTAGIAQTLNNLFYESDNIGSSYRYADLSYLKINQYRDDVSGIGYYPTHHYYEPTLRLGYATYTFKTFQDAFTAFYISRAALGYDSSVVEVEPTLTAYFDISNGEVVSDILYNSTGTILIHPSNLSVFVTGKYKAHADQNGTVIMPLIPRITIKNARNFTIAPNLHIAGMDENQSFPITFNNRSIRTSLDFTNSQLYGNYTNNSINMNITNLDFGSKQLESYNMSLVYNSTNNGMDINISIYWDNNTYPLNRFEYGIPFVIDDNRTAATFSKGNNNFTFIRGMDSVNITNVDLINATGLLINISTGFYGYTSFGKTQLVTIEGNIIQSPITIKYSHKPETSNVYGYNLNQPPNILSNSTNPISSVVDNLDTKWIAFTQNNVNVTWYINNTEVQQNNSISGGTLVYYSNSTAPRGFYIVNATGCNAQGCATRLWNWTVRDVVGSISNIQNTTTTSSINWTWTEPNQYLSYVMIYLNDIWQTNVTAGTQYYLNSSLSPNTEYTISTHAVDTAGNVNQTWVNQTTRTNIAEYIPPTPTNLANTTGNFWVNYTWQTGLGNTTNSFNVSQNGTWTNGSSALFMNVSVSPHGWSNTSVYAYNSSGTGTLNQTPISMNTQVPNNVPILNSVGNHVGMEGNNISFTISGTDADSDSLSCSTNLPYDSISNCVYVWISNYSASGNYSGNITIQDSYGGSDYETVWVNVSNYSGSIVNVTVSKATVNVSENFFINITVDPQGGNITGMQSNLEFDETMIQVNNVSEGNLFSQNGAVTSFSSGTINNNTGLIENTWTVITDAGKAVNQSGTFVIINATAIAVGQSGLNLVNLTISNVIIADPVSQSVPYNATNGSIIVSGTLTEKFTKVDFLGWE